MIAHTALEKQHCPKCIDNLGRHITLLGFQVCPVCGSTAEETRGV